MGNGCRRCDCRGASSDCGTADTPDHLRSPLLVLDQGHPGRCDSVRIGGEQPGFRELRTINIVAVDRLSGRSIEVLLSYGEVAIGGRADGLVRQMERAVGIGDRFSQSQRGRHGPVVEHLLAAAEQQRE